MLEDTCGVPQCGLDIKVFKDLNELIEYLDEHPEVYDRIVEGYANYHFTSQEKNEVDMKNLVICDWQTKGNVVRLYCCDQDKYEDVCGDDWNDTPYEHNAGAVYDEYVDKIVDVYFDFDVVILEAEDDYTYEGNSPFSKKDFKEGKAPIFIAYWPEENDYWMGNEYHLLAGAKNSNRILKYYMGDKIYPSIIGNKKIVHCNISSG
jgi:hypothetical protein